jgi:predicted DNA-binding transcriptional regulator YafY
MRRTDRLFELIQLFRAQSFWRGADLAERLEVSLRTLYRDIDTLVATGVPIEGERGVGYILREPIFLPPLTLTEDELQALQLGAEIIRKAADDTLADAAKTLLTKVNGVVPARHQNRNFLAGMTVLPHRPTANLPHLPTVRRAITNKQMLTITYSALSEAQSTRTIRPLNVEFWGHVWTLTAWCELRQDFRHFRVDRIVECNETGEMFADEAGKTLADFVAGMREGGGERQLGPQV